MGDAVSPFYEPSLHELCADHDLDLLKIVWRNGRPIVVRRDPVPSESTDVTRG
jgi:hypothetical protein